MWYRDCACFINLGLIVLFFASEFYFLLLILISKCSISYHLACLKNSANSTPCAVDTRYKFNAFCYVNSTKYELKSTACLQEHFVNTYRYDL